MALILNIDTSQETASLCIARDEELLGLKINEQQHDHASWIHTAIKELLAETGFVLSEIDAIAVTIGPWLLYGFKGWTGHRERLMLRSQQAADCDTYP